MLTLICCFHGRHAKVERILRCFLNQEYEGEITLLLYNNSFTPEHLDTMHLPKNRHTRLINNYIDLKTHSPYTNVGDIFRDALTFAPKDTKVINFFDSDDIFLPNHASKGMEGIQKALSENLLAYKPYYSYFLYGNNQVKRAHNNMEPSVFVNFEYVKSIGFNPVSASYHQKWLTPLQNDGKILQGVEGTPTFIYCWESDHNTHKISGMGDTANNFEAHRQYEVDYGDGVLSPCSLEIVEKYYDLVKNQ